MKVVIDTNVLMAGLIKDSIVRILLLSPNIQYFLPEHSISEIKKYENLLLKKSGYKRKELQLIMNYQIKIISNKSIKSHMKKAESIMKDIDINDSVFIATALAINTDGIWSFDKHFQKQKKIKVFSTNDISKSF